MSEAEAHRDLIRGLAYKHRHLYETSPEFHQQIDLLAALLPAWVDGLAVAAEKVELEREMLRRTMESHPHRSLNFPGD
jgi:hypothetical protein